MRATGERTLRQRHSTHGGGPDVVSVCRARPLWLGGAISGYQAAFEQARGQGPFSLCPDTGRNGHDLAYKPLFWRPALDASRQLDRRSVPSRSTDQAH